MSKAPEGGYLGYRPVVDGVAGEYEWIEFDCFFHYNSSYTECNERMKAFARALLKYDLLSETDGTQKRTDGTPVLNFLKVSQQMRTFGHYIKNCVAACISQHSVWKINGTVVPLYDTLGPDAIAYLFIIVTMQHDCPRI